MHLIVGKTTLFVYAALVSVYDTYLHSAMNCSYTLSPTLDMVISIVGVHHSTSSPIIVVLSQEIECPAEPPITVLILDPRKTILK